jgi:hypothetical protein
MFDSLSNTVIKILIILPIRRSTDIDGRISIIKTK